MLFGVLCAVVYALRNGTLPRAIVLVPFLYWGGLYVALFIGFVTRSWYGVGAQRKAVRPTVERRAPEPAKPPARVPSAQGASNIAGVLVRGAPGEAAEL
jgi:hypothetical protein